MNYLAHIYLSGKDKQVQIGNFVGDAVKGNAYRNYPPGIQKGILLHRQIDAFSDAHPLVREMVALGRAYFGRYSAVVTDILLDHILARDFKIYAHQVFERFCLGFLLESDIELPEFACPVSELHVAFYFNQPFGTLCDSGGNMPFFVYYG